jgi:hypothetical protein
VDGDVAPHTKKDTREVDPLTQRSMMKTYYREQQRAAADGVAGVVYSVGTSANMCDHTHFRDSTQGGCRGHTLASGDYSEQAG